MRRIMIMSSWVSFGHVGLSAAVPVLHSLGREVTQFPTTILSNHPGWMHTAGQPVPPQQLEDMVDAIEANGWLNDHQSFLTGYLPSAGHVAAACRIIRRLRKRNSTLNIVVDPILGDEPNGLYVPRSVAVAIRDDLVPLANVLTPNSFELGWLVGGPMSTLEDVRIAALSLVDDAPDRRVYATSASVSAEEIGILEVAQVGANLYRTPLRADVPQGVGDAFSAMIAAGLSVGAALGHLMALIDASAGAPHLDVVRTSKRWTTATAISGEPLTIPTET